MMSIDKAGVTRTMDTRPDEQERGITIKSTAITMLFNVEKDIVDDIQHRATGI